MRYISGLLQIYKALMLDCPLTGSNSLWIMLRLD